MTNLFSVPVFFILFRETLEAAIIVSVLITFVHKIFRDDDLVKSRLMKQVWLGTGLGLFISITIGAIFIAVWYTVAADLWASSEELWEGSFGLIASVIVTLMGLGMLKTSRMQDKWRVKLARAVGDDEFQGKRKSKKRYALFFVPFISVIREGVEAVVFLGGISIGESVSSIPIAAIVGILCGIIVGYLIYRGGTFLRLHWFFVASGCLLFLIAAGLFSRCIRNFEKHFFSVHIGGGDDEGSSDVRSLVWQLDCCDSHDGGWSIFKAVLGWSNSATVGTVTGYCLYWVAVMGALAYMKVRDLREAKVEKNAKGENELGRTEEAFNEK